MINHESATQVKETRAVFHRVEFFLAEQVAILFLAIDVQRDHVCFLEQLTKPYGASVATRQYVRAVIKNDAHAHGFREIRQLRADLAVSYDPERESAHFMRAGGRFVPLALV